VTDRIPRVYLGQGARHLLPWRSPLPCYRVASDLGSRGLAGDPGGAGSDHPRSSARLGRSHPLHTASDVGCQIPAEQSEQLTPATRQALTPAAPGRTVTPTGHTGRCRPSVTHPAARPLRSDRGPVERPRRKATGWW